ncbi:hypothetical protein DFJ73DRAFT_814119 [Zopfochytrium polystomum]|nr:hypothetical protein DFJ73DRAFT_814119 [Zopfochytrium polystomum]
MADPSRAVVPFRFFDLPEPIRRRILRMTDLVFSMDSNWLAFQDGIAIWDGRLAVGEGRPFCCRGCSPLRDFSACPTANITTPREAAAVAAAFSPTCRCFAPPVQLLRVAKRMREESERILFSENRFILQGDMAASLRFLRALPSSSLRLVRRLDLQLAGDQAFELAPSDPEHPSRFRQWAALVECVVERMDLPNLELAVDAGDSYEWLLTSGTQADDLQPLRDAYTEVVRPLENLGSKGLKSFHAYWVAFFDQERVAERRVMGEDFDSKRTGKIGYKRRNPRFPHGGVPWDMEMEDLGAA